MCVTFELVRSFDEDVADRSRSWPTTRKAILLNVELEREHCFDIWLARSHNDDPSHYLIGSPDNDMKCTILSLSAIALSIRDSRIRLSEGPAESNTSGEYSIPEQDCQAVLTGAGGWDARTSSCSTAKRTSYLSRIMI